MNPLRVAAICAAVTAASIFSFHACSADVVDDKVVVPATLELECYSNEHMAELLTGAVSLFHEKSNSDPSHTFTMWRWNDTGAWVAFYIHMDINVSCVVAAGTGTIGASL